MNTRHWGVGTKITVFTFALITVILAILLSLINMSTSAMLKERAKSNVANSLNGISNTVEVFNNAMTNEASSFARLFAAGFGDGKFALDPATKADIGGKATPSLLHNGKTLNMDFTIPDKFTSDTGVIVTIFAADGEEFVRVSTSLKKENGERAVGTQLDHAHLSYAPCAPATATSAWPPCSASSTSPSTTRSRTPAARSSACCSSASTSPRT